MLVDRKLKENQRKKSWKSRRKGWWGGSPKDIQKMLEDCIKTVI